MPEETNRHFIPQHYLRGFADSSAQTHVWVYRKGEPYSMVSRLFPLRNPARNAIKSVGCAHGAYSLVSIDGDLIDVDPSITRQEVLGVAVLEKLRARTRITVDDRLRFSLYIDLMRARVPARNTQGQRHMKKAIEQFPWDELQRKAAEEGKFDLALKLDRHRPENVAAFEREMLLKSVPERSIAIAEQIARMKWSLFTLSGNLVFPTTDNPVQMDLPLKDNPGGGIILPIDSQLVLVIQNLSEADLQYVPAMPRDHALLCKRILSGAADYAYSNRNDPTILQILNDTTTQA